MTKVAVTVKCITSAAIAFSFLQCCIASDAKAALLNTPGSFQQIVTNQTPGVAPVRSIIGNMFDGNPSTMYSLGIGGTIQFELPASSFIVSGFAMELTFLQSGHVETAQVYLGNNLGSYVYAGDLHNGETPGGPSVTNASPDFLLTYTAMGNSTSYNLDVLFGQYDSIMFKDVSPAGPGHDGFDIAEFSVISDSPGNPGTGVPEPASIALLGAGLAGVLGLKRRARR